MFDRKFFETTFNEHITAKRKMSADGAVSVAIHLVSGLRLLIWSIESAGDGVIVVEVFPETGTAREIPKDEQDAAGASYDLDRVCIPYSSIAHVRITTAPAPKKDRAAGFSQAFKK
jgi:hypothetical protein